MYQTLPTAHVTLGLLLPGKSLSSKTVEQPCFHQSRGLRAVLELKPFSTEARP